MTPHIRQIYKEQLNGWKLCIVEAHIRLIHNRDIIFGMVGSNFNNLNIQKADELYLKYSKVAHELKEVNKSKRSHQEILTLDLPKASSGIV